MIGPLCLSLALTVAVPGPPPGDVTNNDAGGLSVFYSGAHPLSDSCVRPAVESSLASTKAQPTWIERPGMEASDVVAPRPERATGAEIWIDLRLPLAGVVYFAQPATQRFARRDVSFSVVDAAACETLGLIVATTLQGLLDVTQPALTKPELIATEAHPPMRNDGDVAWSLEAAERGRHYAANAGLRHGVEVGASCQLASVVGGPALWLAIDRSWASTVSPPTSPLGARVVSQSMMAGVSVRRRLGRSADLAMRFGGGVQWLNIQPVALASQAQPREAFDQTRLAARAAVRARMAFSKRWSAFAEAFVDVVPGIRFRAQQEGATETLERSSTTEPGGAIGVMCSL